MSNQGVFNWSEAIERSIRDPVHQADRSPFFVATQTFKIIIGNAMSFPNDPHATCFGHFVSKENVAVDHAPMTVSQRQRSSTFIKDIVAVNIFA